MNIGTFMTWWLNQFVNIGINMFYYMNNIELVANVTLLNFIITITIIGAFINILLTIPNTTNNKVRRESKKSRKEKK